MKLDQGESMESNSSTPKENTQDKQNSQQGGLSGLNVLAQVTTLAWNLVLPIVGGVLLGNYLDRRLGDGVTWTMSLLVLGVIIALSNLYNLYIEHGKQQENKNNAKNEDQVKNEKDQ